MIGASVVTKDKVKGKEVTWAAGVTARKWVEKWDVIACMDLEMVWGEGRYGEGLRVNVWQWW